MSPGLDPVYASGGHIEQRKKNEANDQWPILVDFVDQSLLCFFYVHMGWINRDDEFLHIHGVYVPWG